MLLKFFDFGYSFQQKKIFLDEEEASEELLERLATRHYYSYTAALGVTVGVGCLLLVLNMLIFAGIYYQVNVHVFGVGESKSNR